MKKNISADKFFNQKKQIQEYKRIYKNISFEKEYPANKKRLEIFIDIIRRINPKSILDAGCGNGLPLISILKSGYHCVGFDKAPNMVSESKKNLIKNGFNPDMVKEGDFENYVLHNKNTFDCILGMGTFYYSMNPLEVIKNLSNLLDNDGHIIFSLRNRLFDLVTLNKYTVKFLSELYELRLSTKLSDCFNELTKKMLGTTININSIDSLGVNSQVHNPLTVEADLLSPAGFKLEKLYFYHYHAYPPLFEKKYPQEFREYSWLIENPDDWRGYFIASAFIVHARKLVKPCI